MDCIVHGVAKKQAQLNNSHLLYSRVPAYHEKAWCVCPLKLALWLGDRHRSAALSCCSICVFTDCNRLCLGESGEAYQSRNSWAGRWRISRSSLDATDWGSEGRGGEANSHLMSVLCARHLSHPILFNVHDNTVERYYYDLMLSGWC